MNLKKTRRKKERKVRVSMVIVALLFRSRHWLSCGTTNKQLSADVSVEEKKQYRHVSSSGPDSGSGSFVDVRVCTGAVRTRPSYDSLLSHMVV